MRLVVTNAEVAPGHRVDVRVEGDCIVEVGHLHPDGDDHVVDAGGGAVLPGLHDHHIHLLATAAAMTSVDASADLAGAVKAARRDRPNGWLRATGYHVALSGDLDRHTLDRIDTEPLRVQDHTGSTWFLNSAALDLVVDGPPPPGVELDEAGAPTGRLFRLDPWLRERTGAGMPAEVEALGGLLASFGVTSLTDATATNGRAELELLAGARLPQRLTCMTHATQVEAPADVALGPVKILLDDTQLPELVTLAATISDAHGHGRGVAVHCVTRVQLVLTLAALGWAGGRPGDRIEHGGVIPDDLVGDLRHFGLTVVSQPAFVAARGDRYLADVDLDDQPWLYRLRGLLDAGVPVLGSSDAPYGPTDPWLAVAAACHRRTATGASLGPNEALDMRQALALYTGATTIEPGAPADLCVLGEPWAHVLGRPGEVTVRATVSRGEPVYES